MAVTPALADAFVIEGRQPLSGTIRAAGNKNGALPILAACLLTDEPVTLTNVPRIRDVDTMLELLADLGADAAWTGPNEVRVTRGRRSRSPRPTSRSAARSARRSCSPARCSRASAARRCRRPAAT